MYFVCAYTNASPINSVIEMELFNDSPFGKWKIARKNIENVLAMDMQPIAKQEYRIFKKIAENI